MDLPTAYAIWQLNAVGGVSLGDGAASAEPTDATLRQGLDGRLQSHCSVVEETVTGQIAGGYTHPIQRRPHCRCFLRSLRQGGRAPTTRDGSGKKRWPICSWVLK